MGRFHLRSPVIKPTSAAVMAALLKPPTPIMIRHRHAAKIDCAAAGGADAVCRPESLWPLAHGRAGAGHHDYRAQIARTHHDPLSLGTGDGQPLGRLEPERLLRYRAAGAQSVSGESHSRSPSIARAIRCRHFSASLAG